MGKVSSGRALWALTLGEGLIGLSFALAWEIQRPGLSNLWLASGALAAALWLGLAAAGLICWRSGLPRRLAWLLTHNGRRFSRAVLFVLGLTSFEFFLFSFMFLPGYFRGYALWGLLASLQGWLLLKTAPRLEEEGAGWQRPRLARLDRQQQIVFWVLTAILAISFFLAIPANLHAARDAGNFLDQGEDEVVIYPILINMLQPAENFRVGLYHFLEYDDYHYGFPFYLISALVVLPSRILYGPAFGEQYSLNLPLLRQVVTVLPTLLSALLVTYLGTRFRSLPAAVVTLLLILTAPAVVKSQQFFWHPDALAILCVVLTLFFLDRDRLRFGPDFYLAALCCGLATSLRLVGVFFVFAVGGTLIAGWVRGAGPRRAVTAGAGFLSVILLTILLSSPYLFDAGARGRMLQIMAQKNAEMAFGYGDADPFGAYHTGWAAWEPFLAKDYSSSAFLVYLFVSAVILALVERENPFPALLAAWVAGMGGYLIFFVVVKSYQYGLPAFIPLYGAAFMLPRALEGSGLKWFRKPAVQKALLLLVTLIGIGQILCNLLDQTPFRG